MARTVSPPPRRWRWRWPTSSRPNTPATASVACSSTMEPRNWPSASSPECRWAPTTPTPAMARERHAEARKLLATGVDPMAQRKAEKTAEKIAVENSFQSITTQWLEHWQEGKSPRHVDTLRRRMASDILPCLGARPIAGIEAPELVAMANAIQDRGARDIA